MKHKNPTEKLPFGHAFGSTKLLGNSDALRYLLRQIEMVARCDATVLVLGESGTGKELVASAIHDRSTRAAAPLVKLNCAAIAANLVESELFGHESGAFTGAVSRRQGRFEVANGGTIFLDEIGEMPESMQPKLLRVLQENEFERLGSSRTQRSNVRVVAATNRDLASMVTAREFRADLYYRLNVLPVVVPPLRERREDIPLLATAFACRLSQRMKKNFSSIAVDSMSALTRYSWPGNIRELQNVIERALILSNDAVLEVPVDWASECGTSTPYRKDALDEVTRAHIASVLQNTKGVVAGPQGAASRLGMKRSTLIFRMKKLGIAY